MEFKYDGKVLKFDKVASELDKLVMDFVRLLEHAKIDYVIVSGYVAILLGRSRTTEDIDLFIRRISHENLENLFDLLVKNGYWIIDSESVDDMFDRLQDALSIRIAKEGTVVPNFEVKFAKKSTDFLSLNRPLEVIVNGTRLLTSPLEVQIPFKIWLGSEKDVEDAMHVYTLFKNKLDKELMRSVSKELKVEGEMVKYGIV